MEADIREFLQQFTVQELIEQGILRGATQLLNAKSVEPLISLMTKNGITQLESKDRGWLVTSSGEFVNRHSLEF